MNARDPDRQEDLGYSPIEFLGVLASTHHFHRAHFIRDTVNTVFFTVRFRYRGRPPRDGWNLQARLFVDTEPQPLGYTVPEVTHTDYEEAQIRGKIPFKLSYGAKHPQFRLEIGPAGLAYATLDLGAYTQSRLDPGDMMLNLIEQGNLLRIPNEWPLLAIGKGHYTNLVPGTTMIDRPDSELIQRLAAMTADRARTMGDPKLWVWGPKHGQGPGRREHRERMFIINGLFADCATRLRQELENSYQITFSKERAGSVPLAFVQTREFFDDVGDGRGLCVFGSKLSENLEVVIDLRQLLGHPIGGRLTPSHLDQLYSTATVNKFHEHRLEDLHYDEFEVIDPAGPSELEARLLQATRPGIFLNSEPALVPYWVNFAFLEMGMDAGRDPLLLGVGEAIRAISRLLDLGERIVVANLVGLLNPEFGLAAELTPEKLGFVSDDIRVVNITASAEGEFQTHADQAFQGPVVILTPTDSYTSQIGDFLTWLSTNHLRTAGLVPFVSTAESYPVNADGWDAAFFPVMRVKQGALGLPICEVNQFLRKAETHDR